MWNLFSLLQRTQTSTAFFSRPRLCILSSNFSVRLLVCFSAAPADQLRAKFYYRMTHSVSYDVYQTNF